MESGPRFGPGGGRFSEMDGRGCNTLVEGEADARPMGIGNGPKRPSYNVQTAVDADTALILHHEVTTEPTDNRLLYPIAAAAKDALAVDALTVVADAGYSNGKTQPPASVKGLRHAFRLTVRVTIKATGHSSTDPPSSISATVTPTHVRRAVGWYAKQIMRRDNCVLYAAQDCSRCALKPRCTTAERRLLTRHFHEDALQRMNARVEANPDLMRQRRCAAEHPFGTIKRMAKGGRFLTRGITKVKAEAALSILAYNILRAINLIGPFDLRARLA